MFPLLLIIEFIFLLIFSFEDAFFVAWVRKFPIQNVSILHNVRTCLGLLHFAKFSSASKTVCQTPPTSAAQLNKKR
jgi:hypothetical protein